MPASSVTTVALISDVVLLPSNVRRLLKSSFNRFDVWPPTKDSYSYHLSQTPLVHFVGPLHHFWCGCSVCSAPVCPKLVVGQYHTCVLQPLAFAPWCLVLPWICSLIFQTHFPPPSCLLRACCLFILPCAFCCRVSPSMRSRQRRCHQARSSVNFALPPPAVQVAEAPRCHPQSSPWKHFG